MMNTTLMELVRVLDMRASIMVYKSNEEMVFNGYVYELVSQNTVSGHRETKLMKHEIKKMQVNLGTVRVLLSEEY